MGSILKGVRPLDYVLTLVMLALAVLIGLENTGSGVDVAHPRDSHSVLMIPVFVAAALPILWRRRNVLAAIGVSTLVLAASLPAFGWVTRCGFALPLSVAFGYAVARFAGHRTNQVVGLLGILALQAVTLVMDASTGGFGALPFSVPVAALFYGAGLIVQNQVTRRTAAPLAAPVEHAHA